MKFQTSKPRRPPPGFATAFKSQLIADLAKNGSNGSTTHAKTVRAPSSAPPPPAEDDLPEARSLLEFASTTPDPASTLLGERYLCRGGGLLFVGPSGVGKSSASAQQDALWALGREAFGIVPSRPLKILTIQAENDDGDLHEMARGVIDGALDGDLDASDAALLAANCHYVTINDRCGTAFIGTLDALLARHQPDIVRLDPLFAYAGCDPADTGALSEFLRQGINPVITRHRCAIVINHHCPKITNRDTSRWTALDFSYAAAGGAELTNWARAVLVINQTSDPHIFEFIAAKRGRRIGWRGAGNVKEDRRFFQHDTFSEGMAWTRAGGAAVQAARRKAQKYDVAKLLLDAVPGAGGIEKTALLARVNKIGPGLAACRLELAALLEAVPPVIFEIAEKRTKTRDRLLITRVPPGDVHDVHDVHNDETRSSQTSAVDVKR